MERAHWNANDYVHSKKAFNTYEGKRFGVCVTNVWPMKLSRSAMLFVGRDEGTQSTQEDREKKSSERVHMYGLCLGMVLLDMMWLSGSA